MSKTPSNIKRLAKGTVIVQELDENTRELYLLLQGSVGVYHHYGLNNEAQVNVLSQGNFYGEMSLFLGKDPDATLVALTDVLLLAIDKKNIKEFFAGQPDMAFTIVEGICKKLDHANTMLAQYQVDNAPKESSQHSSLFPKEHGQYLLSLQNDNEEVLYMDKCTCPVCGYIFDQLKILPSKLRVERTDRDLRVHYRNIEPLHYEIITCPNCYLSATTDAFSGISKNWMENINRAVGPYKLETYVTTGRQRDTFTVFAGYYLAILCAAICFDEPELVKASLWQKLSRLYQDCEDNKMYLYASERSLENYLYAYEHFSISAKSMQQLCFVIGDLYERVGQLEQARTYFYYAKTNKAGTNVMARQADIRMDEIKEMMNRV